MIEFGQDEACKRTNNKDTRSIKNESTSAGQLSYMQERKCNMGNGRRFSIFCHTGRSPKHQNSRAFLALFAGNVFKLWKYSILQRIKFGIKGIIGTAEKSGCGTGNTQAPIRGRNCKGWLLSRAAKIPQLMSVVRSFALYTWSVA